MHTTTSLPAPVDEAADAYADAWCRDCNTSPCAGVCAVARRLDADAALDALDEARGPWQR